MTATEAACARLDALPARELRGGLRVASAERRVERLAGLARLDAMPAAYALHLPRCRSVHTFGMRFAIDIAFLDPSGRVLRIERNVPRRRLVRCRGAAAVMEWRSA